MTLVPSLLQAIIRLEGEAVVMHVGDRPYVVTLTGQIDLATRTLTFESVSGIVNQLLPAESQRALDDLGGVQYELPVSREFPGERFTIVAARGGDDVWAEIRRHRAAIDEPPSVKEPASIAASTTTVPEGAVVAPVTRPVLDGTASLDAFGPAVTPLAPGPIRELPAPGPVWPLPAPVRPSSEAAVLAEASTHGTAYTSSTTPVVPAESLPHAAPAPMIAQSSPAASPPEIRPPAAGPAIEPPPPSPPAPPRAEVEPPFVSVPLAKGPTRAEASTPAERPFLNVEDLLRLAAERGASRLYLSSASRPSARIDGELVALDNVPELGATDIESLLLTLMPARNAEALRGDAASDWIIDLPTVGQVRCRTFRDHRGPGCVLRLMPASVVTAQHLGLSREIQDLAFESGGLVIVAGPYANGKRTLVAALIDLINRSRHDHIISIETESDVVHGHHGSLVSQREVRGGLDAMLAAARDALHEKPDVLAIEDLRTTPLMRVALEAAASGQLVIGGFPAHDSVGVIDGIIDLFPPEDRRQVQLALARNLRGVVSQVLVRKRGGGRVAARELLVNTPVVAGLIVEGRTSQLPLAIEAGRSAGMVRLNDVLAGYVRSGVIDVQEADRRAADRAGLRALMKRQGIDTSAIDRRG